MPLRHRRLVTLLVVLAPAAVAAAFALPAGAAPCVDCPGGGGGTFYRSYTHTLTLDRTQGSATSSPAGISCPTDCTLSETHSVSCDVLSECDDDPSWWSTYTLTASGGPAGYVPQWSGCTPSGSSCSVRLDADKTVTLGWRDVQAPTVFMGQPAQGASVGPLMSVSGAVSDNDRVADVRFFVDTVLKAHDTTPPYSATIDMSGYADGSGHTVMMRAYDPAGNLTEVSRSVTVDRHVGVTASSPPAFTNAAAVPVTIGTDSDASMQCKLDSGTFGVCSGTYSPVDASTADGSHTYTVVATDGVGNTASLTRSFVLDRTPPALTITDGPTEGQEVTTSAATVSFDASDTNLDAITCSIDGAAPGPCSTDHSETLAGLPDGQHTLTIGASDKAGNATQRVRTFSVRTSQPPTGSTPTTGTPAGGQPATQQQTPTIPPPPPPLVPRLSFRARVHGRTTKLSRLVVRDLPAGAVVRVRCRGRSCRHKRLTLKAPNGGSVAVKRLLRRRVRAGTRLRFGISAPGRPAETLELRIRKGRKPLVRR